MINFSIFNFVKARRIPLTKQNNFEKVQIFSMKEYFTPFALWIMFCDIWAVMVEKQCIKSVWQPIGSNVTIFARFKGYLVSTCSLNIFEISFCKNFKIGFIIGLGVSLKCFNAI